MEKGSINPPGRLQKKNSLVLGQWSDNLRLTLIALLGEAKCFLASISDKCVWNVPVRGAV